MLTLSKKQERQLRAAIKTFISEHNEKTQPSLHYLGYQIRRQSHGERIYFKVINLFTGIKYFMPNITVTQAKEYFGIK